MLIRYLRNHNKVRIVEMVYKTKKRLKWELDNVTREFEKLLMMLQEKFPDAFKYYEDRLRPPL